MRKSLIEISIFLAGIVVGLLAGWNAQPTIPPSPAQSAIARSTTLGDEHEAWAKVPPTSPDYARAQRLLGYNYFAHDKHDLTEAKRHVDIALAARPDDPKVLEDAGRVYILTGLSAEGTAMLKKADTPIARDFLARRQGT